MKIFSDLKPTEFLFWVDIFMKLEFSDTHQFVEVMKRQNSLKEAKYFLSLSSVKSSKTENQVKKKKNLFNIGVLFAENEDCSNAGYQGISTSLAQEEPQLRPRGDVLGAPPDLGIPQTKPTAIWNLGAGQSREDQTIQQPQQLPIHQQNTQQLTPQW